MNAEVEEGQEVEQKEGTISATKKGRVSLERAAKGPDRAFGVKKKAAGKRRKG